MMNIYVFQFQLRLCLSGTFDSSMHQVDWDTEQLRESLEYSAHPSPKYSPKVTRISEQRDALKVTIKIMLSNIETEVFTESISRGKSLTAWYSCDVHVMPIWFACDTHVVCQWFLWGVHVMMPMWCACMW